MFQVAHSLPKPVDGSRWQLASTTTKVGVHRLGDHNEWTCRTVGLRGNIPYRVGRSPGLSHALVGQMTVHFQTSRAPPPRFLDNLVPTQPPRIADPDRVQMPLALQPQDDVGAVSRLDDLPEGLSRRRTTC
ncbi:hypothetical protein PGT21_004106 [Puccinia graminis f. sp. tritici]|uniref:Uncharacterized protein n=1 Tax=Puccinia graminis f. sp. tritici TaxID=56615 RepID=A0A5B0PMZ2_PUCGR|nr:hypothetical protein PGT21_004106 [Puccinia graminis f. sp. tritici]